jgi:hypothetical protein
MVRLSNEQIVRYRFSEQRKLQFLEHIELLLNDNVVENLIRECRCTNVDCGTIPDIFFFI